MKPSKVIWFIFVLLFPFFGAGQEKEHKLVLNGYVKNLHQLQFVDNLNQLQWTTLVHNRLNFGYTPSKSISLRLEFRNRIFYGDAVSNFPGFSELMGMDNGWVDMTWNYGESGHMLFITSIDRASVRYSKGNWDVTLGRQRVNWGQNLIWNPNDIFNTYNFLDFDYEERPGSDAVRIQYYTGDFSKVELAAKKGRLKDDYIVALLYGFNKWSYDFQLIAGIYKNDWVMGTGWSGNLKNMGFKGEVSYFVPRTNYLDAENVWSASISLDYGFKNGLYIYGSALYNGSSTDLGGSIENLALSGITAKNLMPFEFSGYLQLAKEFSPIFSGSFSTVYSPTNHSVIVIPTLTYSLANNWEMDLISQSFFEFNGYKSLGHGIFFRIRWSF
ncbi:hypothetical protein [Flagellimonas sp.]|jgi:hypothetical protein|uniref:hypothetical protein n=1 Tax=Flagellimonas sp. TaxID=2058762 RepID=UPI003BACF5FD